jgi:hypothetical protein
MKWLLTNWTYMVKFPSRSLGICFCTTAPRTALCGLFRTGKDSKAWRMKLITCLHLVQKVRILGDLIPLPSKLCGANRSHGDKCTSIIQSLPCRVWGQVKNTWRGFRWKDIGLPWLQLSRAYGSLSLLILQQKRWAVLNSI